MSDHELLILVGSMAFTANARVHDDDSALTVCTLRLGSLVVAIVFTVWFFYLMMVS